MSSYPFFRRAAVLFVFFSALTVAGCGSSVEKPTEKLAIAQSAILNARENEAQVYATLELSQAEKKLEQAKEAIAKEEYTKAANLLDQAILEAKHAETKAESARAQSQAGKMRDSIESLRHEIERNQ